MKLTDISEFKDVESYKEMVNTINDNIKGRVALNPHLQATHFLYVVKELMGENCKTLLEIGTLWGGALITMMQSKYDTKFVSIDTFNGFYPELLGEGNTDEVAGHEDGINTIEKVSKNVNDNNPHQHNFDLVEGSSHDEKVINHIKDICPTVDLLFIDGDHTKKGVLQDWKDYSNLLSKGGLVIFDDYWTDEYEHAAWRKTFDDGTKWMDIVGAVSEIRNSDGFSDKWKLVGLINDKFIIERI